MTDSTGISRRRFVQRGAVVTGALLWTAPVVDVLSTQRAFAAAGSGQPIPVATPPVRTSPVTTEPVTTQPVTTDPVVTPSTSVLGETLTRPAPAADDPAVDPVADGRGGTTDPTGALPFTGAGLPVVGALETAGGLIAMGAVLRHLGARSGSGDETDGA